MKFNELSPEEISFIYLVIDEMLDAYNEILDNKGLTFEVDSPIGKIEIFKELGSDELTELKSSIRIKLLRSITDKFSPIVDLIAEENADIIEEVRDALFPKDKEEDDEA
jgi:Mg2+ and Co2+ transporter CorA